MEKIKLAVISQTMNIGGGETMAARLATYIDPERFRVKLFILGPEQDNQIADFLKANGVDYECLGIPTSFHLKGYFKLSRKLKSFAPDVVHEHLDYTYSFLWCWLHRRPLVATIHGDPFRMKNKKAEMMVRFKSKQKCLRMIGCSQMTANQTKSRFSLPDDQVGFVYNPIETADYQPASHSGDERSFVFLHVGRFNPVKNHALLLEAFAKVQQKQPTIRLLLAGDGNLLEETKKLAETLNIADAVAFMGNVEDIPTFLRGGDALVLSSRSEACPMVILEAMATGLPVVATAVGGVPELVTDNGILVPSEDADALADAMLTLATDHLLWEKLSMAASNNVRAFEAKKIARDYENEYLTLVNHK